MGEKDITEKILEDYPDVFADIFNTLVFHGKREIAAEELSESLGHSQYRAEDGKLHEQERDVAKSWKRNNVLLAILGNENQTRPDRNMPVRNIGYDGASYRAQLSGLDAEKRRLRKERKEGRLTRKEYRRAMAGIRGEIVPVVTIVLYFGTERRWNEPKSLKELVHIPEGLEPFVNDYKIHVFEAAWLSEEQIDSMTSDFKLVAKFFRDKRLGTDTVFKDSTKIVHVDELLKFLTAMTGDRAYEQVIEMKEDGKKVDSMCEMAQRMISRGREEGRMEGREGGRLEKAREVTKNLYSLGMEKEKIAQAVNVDVELVKKWIVQK